MDRARNLCAFLTLRAGGGDLIWTPKGVYEARRCRAIFPYRVVTWQQPPGRPHVIFLHIFGGLMKKLATYIVAITGLIGTPAFAADMAVKAPPPPSEPAPVYNWAGWYAGLNVGGTWSDSDISVTSSNLQFCPSCGFGLETALASAQGATNVFSGKTSGIVAGVQRI
jgi:hypothetical protein